MDVLPAIILSRAAEHLIAAIIGVFSVYLGYRLFLNLPHRREGEAKVALPGDVSIFVSRIGPGVFFAVFGSALVAYGVSRPVDYREALSGLAASATAASASGAASKQVQYSGMMPNAPSAGAATSGAVPRDQVVRGLAGLATDVAKLAPGAQRNEREIALREARVAMMEQAWHAEWGDRDAFRRWVYDEAEQDPPPSGILRAVAVYRGTP
jgi:hypothetical protein